jgi:hypothetical protein
MDITTLPCSCHLTRSNRQGPNVVNDNNNTTLLWQL